MANAKAKQTAVAVAVSGTIAKTAQTAAAATVELAVRERLEAYLSPEQVDGIEDYAAMCLDHQLVRDTWVVESRAIVARIFPRLPDWKAWKPLMQTLRAELGKYAADEFRNAVKAAHGALPTAGTGKGSGTKGVSAKREAKAFASEVDALLARLERVRKCDIDGATLAKVAKAVDGIVDACAALAKAVNE
jgi:hypothetical protein